MDLRSPEGQALMVAEATKMDITLHAPAEATAAEVRHAVGDMVEKGRELVTVEAA